MPERGSRNFSNNNIGTSAITTTTTTREDYDEDEEFYVIGDRVLVDGYRAGSVAYFGETEFALGDWVGVVLDEPTGNHDGKLHGREYFQCAPNHGIFVRTHRVSQTMSGFNKYSAPQLRTPTPTYNQLSGGVGVGVGVGGNRWGTPSTTSTSNTPIPYSRCSSNRSPANSLLDSYYYDDDYRQDRGPTINSLARKLKSIDEQQQQQRQLQDRSVSSTPAGILKHYKPTTGCVSRNGERTSRWTGSSNSQSSGLGSSQHDLASATSMSLRMDDLDRRLRRASSMSPTTARRSSNSVFNFRPKREPLSDDHRSWPGRTKHKSLDDYDDDDANDSTRVNFSSELPKLGDRVWVRTERAGGELTGVLRFMGETEFATGEWAGVELDERLGKNDGSILGHRYFNCPQGHGLFVPALRVRKCPVDTLTSRALGKQRDQFNSFDTMRSTILSPPPVPRRRQHYEPGVAPPTSRSSSSSVTPSSYAYQSSPLSPDSPSSSSGSRGYGSPETDDRWRQPALEPPVRTYVSRATSITPNSFDRGKSALLERHYNRAEKFDDRDLERELKRSSSSSSSYDNSKLLTSSRAARPLPRAKAVTYTFITNKLDGTPIAKRTLVYE